MENETFLAEPYRSVSASSSDGLTWSALEPLPGLDRWLLWRAFAAGQGALATAYWYQHGRSVLLETRDGTHWSILSEIHRGDRNDGTEAIALPDGRRRRPAHLELSRQTTLKEDERGGRRELAVGREVVGREQLKRPRGVPGRI